MLLIPNIEVRVQNLMLAKFFADFETAYFVMSHKTLGVNWPHGSNQTYGMFTSDCLQMESGSQRRLSVCNIIELPS